MKAKICRHCKEVMVRVTDKTYICPICRHKETVIRHPCETCDNAGTGDPCDFCKARRRHKCYCDNCVSERMKIDKK